MLYAEKARSHIQKQIIRRLMPDTCTIYPPHGTAKTVSDEGVLTSLPADPITYNGSSTIPCRFDVSGSFRPDKLKNQAIDVEEYYLILPFDMSQVVKNDYIVHYRGNVYQIRRIHDISEFDTYIQCQLSWVTAE